MRSGTVIRRAAWSACAVLVLLATINLTRWPRTWFDEGIHLQVPKTLVRTGVYAAVSSEGFRYYGPTLSVGPTVMLPVAGAFQVLGIGLLQARLVMAIYLVAFGIALYRLGRHLAGPVTALLAAGLVLVSPGPSAVEYGRQALGEVPGGFFLVTGLLVWFWAWRRPDWWRLAAAGGLLGLATMTKHVYLLALAPALLAGWFLDRTYYRQLPHRVFLVTGTVCAACFLLWQAAVLVWLAPGTFHENWALLRRSSAGAAFVFDPALSKRTLLALLGVQGYAGLLVPAIAHAAWPARRRVLREQQWAMVWLIAVANLAWFVIASNGWPRYAFVGLTLSALLVARFLRDLLRASLWRTNGARRVRAPLLAALLTWIALLIGAPLAQTATRLVRVPPDDAGAIAAWLDDHVPSGTIIETWEPELGVLTDHRYHYPPPALLVDAVAHIWQGGPSPATRYAFRDGGAPAWVVVGQFARWVGLYPDEDLQADYERVHQAGAYVVWRHVGSRPSTPQEPHGDDAP